MIFHLADFIIMLVLSFSRNWNFLCVSINKSINKWLQNILSWSSQKWEEVKIFVSFAVLHLYTVNADLSVFDFAATSLLDMTRTKSIRWPVEFALIGFYCHTLFKIIGLSYKVYPGYVRLFFTLFIVSQFGSWKIPLMPWLACPILLGAMSSACANRLMHKSVRGSVLAGQTEGTAD